MPTLADLLTAPICDLQAADLHYTDTATGEQIPITIREIVLHRDQVEAAEVMTAAIAAALHLDTRPHELASALRQVRDGLAPAPRRTDNLLVHALLEAFGDSGPAYDEIIRVLEET